MAGQITRTKNTKLGLKLNTTGLGWALIERERPKRQRVERGDVLAMARKAAATWDANANGPFTLFSYENDAAFAESLAAQDGLPRSAHTEMVEFVADQLASEGFNVTICEIA